ncbi:hypothetical protein IJ425_05265 [bacterium]|nr:hypothetical protein [bacterium]
MAGVESLNPQYSQKPGFFKCVGKGITRTLKCVVPVWGRSEIGDEFVKQNQINENIKDIKTFGKYDSENDKKTPLFKRYASGFAASSLVAPIIGTYATGLHKVQHEQLKDEIEALKVGEKPLPAKKPGVFKTYFIGLWEKVKRTLPVAHAYVTGKYAIEIDNMKNDLAVINSSKKA